MKIIWVKKSVDKKDFKEGFYGAPSYCKLNEEGRSVMVGFEMIKDVYNNFPENRKMELEVCNDDDISVMDNYRRANNIRPFPLAVANGQAGKLL